MQKGRWWEGRGVIKLEEETGEEGLSLRDS